MIHLYICSIDERDYSGIYQKLVTGEADAHVRVLCVQTKDKKSLTLALT
jgi:hypothetical protein